MKELTILVDMDDTIECLLDAWVAYLNERHGTNVDVGSITEWDLTTAFPTLTKEQVYAPLTEDALWETVKPMDGAAEVLEYFQAQGHKVVIVTATAYQTVKSKMENVLFKYFPFLTWKDVIIASNKQVVKGDILIDDAPHNLVGGDYIKVLMTASHNCHYDAKANDMYRVNNWEDVQRLVYIIAHADEFAEYSYLWETNPEYALEMIVGAELTPTQRYMMKILMGG